MIGETRAPRGRHSPGRSHTLQLITRRILESGNGYEAPPLSRLVVVWAANQVELYADDGVRLDSAIRWWRGDAVLRELGRWDPDRGAIIAQRDGYARAALRLSQLGVRIAGALRP
jgi:hypothetical protein